MRSRRPSPEHTEAVARRLAELSQQLAATRASVPEAVGDEWWSDHTRISQRPLLSVVPPVPGKAAEEPYVPPVVEDVAPPLFADEVAPRLPVTRLPVPGRHAARRPLSWAPDLVPAALRGGVRLGAPQLTAVAVLVAVGLALTCWWVVRGDPAAPVPVSLEVPAGAEPGRPVVDGAAPTVEAPPEMSPPAVTPPAQAGAAQVTVDVEGRVRRPGIVVLESGARVVDALTQAGGARAGVDVTSLNLARLLVDGEQIVVGPSAAATVPPVASAPPAAESPAPTVLVDLNLADQAALESLPDVGPVTATAIIAWRTEHGGFTSITELLEVDGIGDATLARLTPYVTV